MTDNPLPRLLWTAHWLRAALEASAAFLLSFLLLLALRPSAAVWSIGLIGVALTGAGWCALRIQPPAGTGQRRLPEEIGRALGAGAVLTVVVCIPVYSMQLFNALNLAGFERLDLGLPVFTGGFALFYAAMRIGIGFFVPAGKFAEARPGGHLLQTASPIPAWLEAVLGNLLFFFLLMPILYLDHRTATYWFAILLLACAACSAWFALRVRISTGAAWKIALRELGLLAAANAAYYAGICLPILLLGWTAARPGMWFLFPPNKGIYFSAFAITAAFLSTRALVRLSASKKTPGGRDSSASEAAAELGEQPKLLIFFRTGFWRPALEAAAGTFLLSLIACTDPLQLQNPGIVVIPIFFALWCTLRMRLTFGSPWNRIQKEFVYALTGGMILSGAFALAVFLTSFLLARQAIGEIPLVFLLVSILTALLFGVFRTVFSIIYSWRRLQRRSMVLTLTNAILSTVLVVITVVGGLFIVLVTLLSNVPLAAGVQPNPLSLVFFRISDVILPMLVGIALLLFALTGVILPPAILFSYLVARSNTQRIRELAEAAGALRAGNYSVQVAVKGEDEVARLQADFNAMAADLNRTVGALQTERDRVSGLLQSRRELVAGVSHELRTPVSVLRVHLESARHKRSLSALSAELDVLDREVIRLQNLIEDLFALSQAEVNKLTLDLRPVDAGEIVRERVSAMAPLAWQPGRVQVTAETAAGVPRALADRMRLEQALTNLIHNAARYTPPGGMVAVSVSSEADTVRIDVRDTGEGIVPKDLPRIWDRYYRGKGAIRSSGSGLGLALVKEFVEAMGGSVAAESEAGKGSCFTLRLKSAGQ